MVTITWKLARAGWPDSHDKPSRGGKSPAESEKNMSIIEKSVLAHRCQTAGLTGIYKSYIRDIKQVASRREPDWFMAERDFSFTHKGKRYIVRAEIECDKRYSAKFKYTAEEVK